MSDVEYCYAKFCRPLDDKQVAFLERKGVHPDALGFDETRKLFRVMTASVQISKSGWGFGFGEPGLNAVIIVCRDESGAVADMAAWMPKDDSVRLWAGDVAMLGEETVLQPRLEGDKLWAHTTPLEWLVHRRTGVVVINFDRARSILAAASPLHVKSKEFKIKLEAAWRAPRILVADDGVAAATVEAVS